MILFLVTKDDIMHYSLKTKYAFDPFGIRRKYRRIKRFTKIAKYGTLAGVFIYGAVKVHRLIKKIKTKKADTNQRKQIEEMYADFKKQKSR